MKISRLTVCPETVFDGAFLADAPGPVWESIQPVKIEQYPWFDKYPYRCRTEARLGLSESGLEVLMCAWEEPIIAKETRWGGDVYLDSCMELFLMPFPETDKRYLNIEINPMGVAHVGCGEGRNGRTVHRERVEGMDIKACHTSGFWALRFCVPNSLVTEHFGKPFKDSGLMRGNLYKCSGPALHEHYGCWNAVGTAAPDFHRPEYFGDMLIEPKDR